jgi:hypothetical protein
MTPTDTNRLDALADWMRARGATRVVLTDASLEVDLGPEPVAGDVEPRAMTAEEYQAELKAEQERRDRTLGLIE